MSVRPYVTNMDCARDKSRPVWQRAAHAREAVRVARREGRADEAARAESLAELLETVRDETAIQ